MIEDTPLKKIEAQTFLGVNKTLEELHLIHTELEKFPNEAFEVIIKQCMFYRYKQQIAHIL